MRGGKDVRQRVVTGLAGNSSTIVLSGLKAGETVVLPAARAAQHERATGLRLAAGAGAPRWGRLGGGAALGGGWRRRRRGVFRGGG